jgi:hypothetical protein
VVSMGRSDRAAVSALALGAIVEGLSKKLWG